MRKLLATYRNGNYTVDVFFDGTKIKKTRDKEFIAEFPDSIDLKITDYCDLFCPMCHERSSVDGREGDLNAPFLGTLHSGTELAIGGGNPLSHKGLLPFLEAMRSRGVIANLTVNARHLLKNKSFVESLLDRELIHGLGISMSEYTEDAVEFAKEHGNAVLHLINGVYGEWERLFDGRLKILILGYKQFGRGKEFYDARVAEKMCETKKLLPTFVDRFECVSFDNLAIEQLGVREMLGEESFSRIYMGDDGEASMYIDLSKGEFARSSTSVERYPLLSCVKAMFDKIKILKR